MQILYFNNDVASARKLHAEFLSYKGFRWDLVHCKTDVQLLNHLAQGEFDAVLYQADLEEFAIRDALENVVRGSTTPVVGLINDKNLDSDSDQSSVMRIRSVDHGFHEVMIGNKSSGQFVMRRLRMARARVDNYIYQPTIGAQQLLAKLDVAAMSSVMPSTNKPEGDGAFSMPDAATSSDSQEQDEIRILNVEIETTFDRFASRLSQCQGLAYKTVSGLVPAEQALAEEQFDAVFIEQGVIENQEIERHKKLRNKMRELPFIMTLVDRSDFAAVTCIENGFVDAIVAAQYSPDELMLTIKTTMARNRRVLANATLYNPAAICDRRTSHRTGQNRRRSARYLIRRPLTAIAVLPDGSPDRNNVFLAESIDFSIGGVGFKIPNLDRLPSRSWVVGVHNDDHSISFSNVLLRQVDYLEDGIKIGAMFQPESDDLISLRKLQSRIEAGTGQVAYGWTKEALDAWAELGVLQKSLTQKIKCCPECQAVSTVEDGCEECGSVRLEFRLLLHHFACAHVDDRDNFQNEAGISCPKCLTSDLVVGSDFEIIKTHYQCETCGHESNQLEQVGSCFNCRLRYPLKMADILEVFRFDVQRLDILDFLSSAK